VMRKRPCLGREWVEIVASESGGPAVSAQWSNAALGVYCPLWDDGSGDRDFNAPSR
jgi:hypothetical protein